MNEFFTLMKSELLLTGIIFILLIIKIGKGMKHENLLSLIQILLLLNFLAGFFWNNEGQLFGGMYHTGALMGVQREILNLGVDLVS